jgi:hypothetical protein
MACFESNRFLIRLQETAKETDKNDCFKEEQNMIPTLFKILFMMTAAGAGLYSISIFGTGMWSYIILGVAGLQSVSLFIAPLMKLAALAARATGIVSVVGLLLVLVAATTGGSFSMSESNIILSFLLVLLSVFGLSAVSWPVDKK